MGIESFSSDTQEQNPNEILEDYGKLAEQSQKEQEMEESMPRLSKSEEMRIRDQIETHRNAAQAEMNKENYFRETKLGGEEHSNQQIELAIRVRLAHEAEISRLERELRRAEK